LLNSLQINERRILKYVIKHITYLRI